MVRNGGGHSMVMGMLSSMQYGIWYWATQYGILGIGYARGHVGGGHDIMHGPWRLVRIAFHPHCIHPAQKT